MKSKLISNASWLLAGGAFNAGVAFFSSVVLMRILMPEDFGRYAILQANVSLVGTFINFRISDHVLRVSESEFDKEFYSSLATGILIQSILVGLVSVGILSLLGICSVEGLWVVAAQVLGIWSGFFVRVYERGFHYKQVSLLENGAGVSAHVFAVVGALLGAGPIVLYLRDIVRSTVQLIYLFRLKAIQLPKPNVSSFWSVVRLRRELSGIWLDGMLEQTFHRIVIIILGMLSGDAATGFFFQARRLAILPYELVQSVAVRMSYNYFSQQKIDSVRYQKLFQLVTLEFVIMTAVGLAAVALADSVIPTVFGEKWRTSADILEYLFGMIVFITIFNTVKVYFMANGDMKAFITAGRMFQYLGFGAGLFAGQILSKDPVICVAMGLSMAYILPVTRLLMSLVFLGASGERKKQP